MNDLSRLGKTVKSFCQFIRSLPAVALEDQPWGPKEVLAHLVYHHELYVSQLEALVAGEPVQPPSGTFRALNAKAVLANKSVASEDLVARFQNANERLTALYRQHDPSTLAIEIKSGAKLRTLAALIPEVEAHIRNHQKKLQKMFAAKAE